MERHPVEAPPAKQIFAAVIGNALEWYDFVVFGFLTVIISSVFFPSANEYASLLLTMASFGVGFVMRPIGGIFIGVFADRKGRRAALQLIIALTAVGTAAVAFTPGYAAIGLASSVIIVVARMLQGLAAGGEYASASAWLLEMAPAHKRGFYGSWQAVGQSGSLLLGALAGVLVTRGFTHDQLYAWAWRLPFVLGLIIAPVGIWIRNHLTETGTAPEASGAVVEMSLVQALKSHGKALWSVFLLTAAATIAMYVLVVYMPTFANKSLNISLDDAFMSQTIALVVMTVLVVVFGALSDRTGHRTMIRLGLVLYIILLVPLYSWVVQTPSATRLTIAQTTLCAILAMILGPCASSLAGQFSIKVRSTGLAISYNLSVMVFGGFAQFIVTWLLHETGSLLTPAYYLLFGALLGLVGSFMLKETAELPSRAGVHVRSGVSY